MTSTALQDLAADGVSIWLDDLSRERLTSGNLAAAHRRPRASSGSPPTRRSSRPPCPRAHAYDDQVRELAACRRRPSTRPCSPSPPRTCATPATSSGRSTRPPAAMDGRVSIEVDPRLAHDTASDRRGGQGTARPRSTGRTCSSRSRRRSRACPPSPQAMADGHQRQRDADLRPRPLPRRDERVPRPGWSRPGERRPRPVRDRTRSPRSSSPGSTPRSTSGSTSIGTDEAKALRARPRVANARLAYQAYEEVFSTPRWQALADDGRPRPASAVGLHRRQGPGLPRHDVRHRARRARHRQHDAGEDPRRRRRPRRGRRATPSRRYYAEAAEVLDGLERARHLLRRGHRDARARGRRQVREVLGRAARRASPTELEKATA